MNNDASAKQAKGGLGSWNLFQGIRPFDKARLRPDILAGISLAAVNIPQAMGYTKIAGTPAVTGLYTLLLPVIAFAVFGASRYLVVAADSATAAILATGVSPLAAAGSGRYMALASMVALLVAAFLLLARLLRLGFLADFMSRTVLIGFLTGVGFQVGTAMLGGMFGIAVESRQTVAQFLTVLVNLPGLHWPTLAVSAGVVAVLLVTARFTPRIPGPIVALAALIILSATLDFSGHGIAVLGPVAGGLPGFGFPEVTLDDVAELLPTAGACFVMVVAQSSATARAYATRHEQTLDENRELLGLAAADAAAGLSGTFVVNGSPTQTAMLEVSGGGSQVSHLTTAVVTAAVLLAFTGPLRFLPVCALGAIVFVVAVRLIDVSGLRKLRRSSPDEFVLALLTTAAVVFLGVGRGIILALVLSLLDHVRHGYQPHSAVVLRDPVDHWQMVPVEPGKATEPGLVLYWFGADLYYANANLFTEQVRLLAADGPPAVRWLVVDSGAITGIDYSAGSVLRQLHTDLAKKGVVLAFTRVNDSFREDLERMGLTDVIGAERLFRSRKTCIAAFLAGQA